MCKRGSTREVLIDGKSISIDSCIADTVEAINRTREFRTLGSCCGHGIYPTTIIVRSETHLGVGITFEYYSGKHVPRERNFYRKDAAGIYFLPEVRA